MERSHSAIGLNRSLHLYNNGVQRMKIRNLKVQKCRNERKLLEMTDDHTFIPKINQNSSMIAENMGRSSKKETAVYYLDGEMIKDPLVNMQMNKFRQNKSVYQRLVEKAELRDLKLKKKAK
jgi:hypothetical protein